MTTGKAKISERVFSLVLALALILSLIPFGVYAATPSELTTDINEKTFVVGTPTVFTFTTTPNDDAGIYVKGSFKFNDMSAIASLEYQESKDGSWHEFNGEFGPETGFPMMETHSTFRVTFSDAGVYSVSAYIKTVEDGTVLCSVENIPVTVEGVSSLTTDIKEKTFAVNDLTNFSFETMANGDTGIFVLGSFEFKDSKGESAQGALEVLEYQESQTGEWYAFYGDFGPATGFPLVDNAKSNFRAKFNTPGTYTLHAYMKKVDNGDVLCFCDTEIVVKEHAEMKYTTDSIEIKYSDTNVINDTLVDTVENAEYTYSSEDESVVTIDASGILHPVGVGKTNIVASRVENAEYVSDSASYAVTVVEGDQGDLVWAKTNPGKIKWNDAEGFSNTVTGGSGDGDVTYASSDTDVADVDPVTGVLTLKKPGKVVITATKEGTDLYSEKTASYELELIKSEQIALVFDETNPDALHMDFGTEFTNAATGGSSENDIKYSSSDENIATVDENGKVTALKQGVVTITASRDGDDYYLDAETVSYTVTIYRAVQTTAIEFEKGVEGQKITFGDKYTNAATGGDTAPIEYSSSDTEIAVVDPLTGEVTALKSGTVTITATVPESDQYKEQTASYELVIEVADQKVTFENGNTNIPAVTYGDEYSNKASAATEITYSSSDEAIAEIDSEGKLIIHKAGTVVITATAKETEQYNGASDSYTITINKAEQLISFEKGTEINVTFNDNANAFANPASSNATNGDEDDKKDIVILYEVVSGSDFIEEDSFDTASGEFVIKGAGTITVAVSFGGNDRYKANEASYTLTVAKDDQTISFGESEYEVVNGDNSFTAPTAAETSENYGTGKIVYSIEKNDDGVVSAIDSATGVLTFTNETGSVTVKAVKEADSSYNEASATYTLTVTDWEVGESVLYTLSGDKINDSGWFTGNVSIVANEGYLVSYNKTVDTAEWKASLDDAVKDDGIRTIEFYLKNEANGQISDLQSVEIKKDAKTPTASIDHKELSGWEKFLTIITIGIWEPGEKFIITSGDETSDVANVKYYIDEGTTEVMKTKEIGAIEEEKWIDYADHIDAPESGIFVIYARVTDNAGNIIYATTNGLVFDTTAPTGKIEITTEDHNGFYNSDVTLKVTAEDADPSSGIASITYEIKSETETETGTLYTFENENPNFEDLENSVERELTVSAKKFNSDNVKVTVTVTDNAGNVNTEEISVVLNICTDTPELLEFEYIDDPDVINEYEGIKYYNTTRTVKVVLSERNSVFEATAANRSVVVNQTMGDSSSKTTYEIIDWVSSDITLDGQATHTLYIKFKGSANYDYSVSYEDVFGNKVSRESETFVIDTDKPTACITIDEKYSWDELLETLSFGLWKNASVTVTANSSDATSPMKSFDMYKTDKTEILSWTDLDELFDNGEFTEYSSIPVEDDEKFTVYIRVEDYAGNYNYICSDGFVVDTSNSVIVLTSDHTELSHNGIPLYNGDVNVQIDVHELKDEAYSGIKEVKYWVTCDGKTTKEETLYTFNYSMEDYGIEGVNAPKYSELLHDFTQTVKISAAENNSCKVVLYVGVTDNAGNYVENNIALDIDMTPPAISVTYDNNSPFSTVGERGYYPANRTATIVITERTEHFNAEDATAGIRIKAVDSAGNTISGDNGPLSVDNEGYLTDISQLFGDIEWITDFGETPDQDTHTLVLEYKNDANYTFSIAYTDLASNANEGVNTDDQETPYEFTIDKLVPSASITAELETWAELVKSLSFGLYSNDEISISATKNDATCPLDLVTIEYYKTNKTTVMSADDLDALEEKEWTDISSDPKLIITEDERLTVYLKVTDKAGNYIFISSDGYILDKRVSGISLIPDHTELSHNGTPLYNGDVNVLIEVNELTDDAYSGIKEVKYWVTCDGKTTKEETLYTFDYSMKNYEPESESVPKFADLKKDFSETVTIIAAENNSCDVVLYVGVTDNAGNYEEKSVAVDIDITVPTISVSYDNNSPYKTVENRGYYPANRTATIVITERTGHFEAAKATAGIRIKATDFENRTVSGDNGPLSVDSEGYLTDISQLFGPITWNTTEGKTPDQATHTLVLEYDTDANYTFSIEYADMASNVNDKDVNTNGQETPYEFTVDKAAPTGTVTVGDWDPWDALIEALTFGLWSRDTVPVTAERYDVTSPIESWDYYRTADTTAKTADQLRNLAATDWTPYADFSVVPDEQFTVYIRIVDNAGNTTFISTNGVIVDHTIPEMATLKPEITLTAEQQPAYGIYNKDVRVAVKVVDPTFNGAYSGLKEVRYEVYNLNTLTQGTGIDADNGILYTFGNANPTQSELYQVYEKNDAIIVSSSKNNSNEVLVKVFATDNSGNTNEAELKLMIDITAPTISVSYDNNDGDTTFADASTDAFFKADRVASVVITERNFDPDKVVVNITNTDGVIPVLSGWTTSAGSGNGDATTHTATITYSADGDYTFDISYTDQADNANEPVNYTGLAVQKFTIDKTLPKIKVEYDNNSVQNGNYYKAQRIATLTVVEHNFETSRINIALTASDDGVESALPTVSSWASNGDTHVATITYANDSLYTFDFDYIDKAGNATTDIEQQSFYVDKTNPEVTITEIVDNSANNDEGSIGYVITATDTNFDVFTPVLTAVIKNGDEFETKQLDAGSYEAITNGNTYIVNNLEIDGIYRITCTVIDKAGNAYSEVNLAKEDGSAYVEKRGENDTLVTFSVNRFGSTFELDANTVDLLDKYYIQNVTNDIVIVEINADPLEEYNVALNGKTLSEDQYKVDHTGGEGKWEHYTYTLDKKLFEAEGEYTVVISSKDKATNDAFSDVKNASVKFVVDRTAPIVTVTGLAEDGRYQTESQTVTIIPTDDGGAFKSIVVTLVDEDGEVLSELLNLSGEEFIKALEEGNGQLTFEVPEGLYQNVRIVCDDEADFGSDENIIYDKTITNVSVASSAFLIFWANKPLRWGSIGGAAALTGGAAAFIVFKKRKKDDEEEK